MIGKANFPQRTIRSEPADSCWSTLDCSLGVDASNRTCSSSLILPSLLRDPALLPFREIDLEFDFLALLGALTKSAMLDIEPLAALCERDGTR